MENSARNFLKRGFSTFTIFYCLFTPYAFGAAPETVEDIPAPYNLQAAVLNQTVTLSWAWDPPDPSPPFQTFGYQVFRDNAVIANVKTTAYTDFSVAVGTHTYKVMVKGNAKEMGKTLIHVSTWSEPADAKITQTCGGPPSIQLQVEPTKKAYGAIPSLRLHFTGDVKVPTGCRAPDHVVFHIDSGLSTERTGPLFPDSNGHFDEFVDAMGPEEETITGAASFKITVTAKDEVGGSASDVFTIDLAQENPYAPKQHPE